VNSPLGLEENNEHALDSVLHLSRLFSVSVSLNFPSTAHAFITERLFKQFQGLRRTFSEI
jgi:hypothetical protein